MESSSGSLHLWDGRVWRPSTERWAKRSVDFAVTCREQLRFPETNAPVPGTTGPEVRCRRRARNLKGRDADHCVVMGTRKLPCRSPTSC